MSGWLGSNWLRVVAYAVAAAAALLAGVRERRRSGVEDGVWPTFWFVTAGLFLLVVLARATDLGGWATALGRDEAVAHGWYSHRRKVQALVVGSIGVAWFLVVVAALLRFHVRRRRYLPAAIVVFSLMCLAGIRLVSLHQIDAVLYRRSIAGLKVGALMELVGVLVAVAVTFWRPRSPSVEDLEAPPPAPMVDAESTPGRT
jgi:hypothetical protein